MELIMTFQNIFQKKEPHITVLKTTTSQQLPIDTSTHNRTTFSKYFHPVIMQLSCDSQ